jgi:hypothetical protein
VTRIVGVVSKRLGYLEDCIGAVLRRAVSPGRWEVRWGRERGEEGKLHVSFSASSLRRRWGWNEWPIDV